LEEPFVIASEDEVMAGAIVDTVELWIEQDPIWSYWICSWKFGKPVIQAYLNVAFRGRVKPESLGISFSSQEAILRHGIKRRWFQYKVRTCPGMLS
jgi:hypothetical protein